MILSETPETISPPGDSSGPPALVDRIERVPFITGLGVGVTLFTMMDQNYSIRAKYFLDTIVDDLHLGGIVLILLVDLPIHIQHYKVGVTLVQQSREPLAVIRCRDDAGDLKQLRIRHENGFGDDYPVIGKLLKPIPPYHLTGIELDIEYGAFGSSTVVTKYRLTTSEIEADLECQKRFPYLGRGGKKYE